MNDKDSLLDDTCAVFTRQLERKVKELRHWRDTMTQILEAHRMDIAAMFPDTSWPCHEDDKLVRAVSAALADYHAELKEPDQEEDDNEPVASPDQALLTPIPVTPVTTKKNGKKTRLTSAREHIKFSDTATFQERLAESVTRVTSAQRPRTGRPSRDSAINMAQIVFLLKAALREKKLKPDRDVNIGGFLKKAHFCPTESLQKVVFLSVFHELSGVYDLRTLENGSIVCKLSAKIAEFTFDDVVNILLAMSLHIPDLGTVLEHAFPPTVNWYYAKHHRLIKHESWLALTVGLTPDEARTVYGSAKGNNTVEDNIAIKKWRPQTYADTVDAAHYMIGLLDIHAPVAIRRVRIERAKMRSNGAWTRVPTVAARIGGLTARR